MGSRLPSCVSEIGQSRSGPNSCAGRASQWINGPRGLSRPGRRLRRRSPSALAPALGLPGQSAGGSTGRGTGR
eukprot:3534177-Alexandrium_andersonii.AAC.1